MKQSALLLSSLLILLVTLWPDISIAQSETVDQNITTQKHKAIQGDWATDYFRYKDLRRVICFSFLEKTCTYLSPYGNYSAYSISNDTLIIQERILFISRREQYGGKKKLKFEILSLSEDSMSLRAITQETQDQVYGYNGNGKAVIQLKKIQQKNALSFSRISFYSTMCYGSCPSMYWELDSLGNFFFQGMHYTEKEGMFSGRLSKADLNRIKQRLNAIDTSGLNQIYRKDATDGQYRYVKIKTGVNISFLGSSGPDSEPIEHKFFLLTLMEIYKVVALTKDATIMEKFELRN